MASFFGFGATGLRGEACPVPNADGVVPFTFRPETHDNWCNCMYSSDPALLYLCKIKFGEKLPNGDVYLDPSMPWTVTGKRTRGLENDALGRALQQILHAASGAVQNAANTVIDAVTTPDPHASTPIGPATQTSPNQTSREYFYTLQQGGATSRVVATPDSFFPDLSVSDDSSKKLLLGGAIALGVWYFLVREPPRAVSGFGGYRRRRRSRR